MTVRNDRDLRAEPIATPFTATNVNPASLDLTLAPEYIDRGWSTWHSLMPKRLAMALSHRRERIIPAEGMLLWPGTPIIASTAERITMPDHAGGMLLLKSTTARLGTNHLLAGWFDPGFDGDGTLELYAVYPTWLTRHMRIVQMVVFNLSGIPDRTYAQTGRYQGQIGPTEAR